MLAGSMQKCVVCLSAEGELHHPLSLKEAASMTHKSCMQQHYGCLSAMLSQERVSIDRQVALFGVDYVCKGSWTAVRIAAAMCLQRPLGCSLNKSHIVLTLPTAAFWFATALQKISQHQQATNADTCAGYSACNAARACAVCQRISMLNLEIIKSEASRRKACPPTQDVSS